MIFSERSTTSEEAAPDLPDVPSSDIAVNGRTSFLPRVDPKGTFDSDHPQIRQDILRMIAQYLRGQGWHASAAVIADEAQVKVTEQSAKRMEVKQLRRAIVDGDLDLASQLILKVVSRQHQRRCLWLVFRQEYLELIEAAETQRAFAFLNKRLKPLERSAGMAAWTSGASGAGGEGPDSSAEGDAQETDRREEGGSGAPYIG